MTTPVLDPRPGVGIVRRAVQAVSILLLAFFLLLLLGHIGSNEPFAPTLLEWLLFGFLFGGLTGIVVAWWYEIAGGLLLVGSYAGFSICNFLEGGRWFSGWVMFLFAVLGAAFMLLGWQRRRRTARP